MENSFVFEVNKALFSLPLKKVFTSCSWGGLRALLCAAFYHKDKKRAQYPF